MPSRDTRMTFKNLRFKNKTDPLLAQPLTYTLINGPETSFVSMLPSTASSLLCQAALEQDSLGWDNFLFDRMTALCARAQQQYFDYTTPTPNNHHGSGWMRRLISRVYEMVHEVWLYPNSVVHETIEDKLNKQALRKLNEEIDRFYSIGSENICPTHRHLFDEGITATKERPARQKKYWIRTLQVSLDYRKHVEENMFVGMRTIMRRWAMNPD